MQNERDSFRNFYNHSQLLTLSYQYESNFQTVNLFIDNNVNESPRIRMGLAFDLFGLVITLSKFILF